MTYKYYMPTKIFCGEDSIFSHSHELKKLGKKAMLVTGKTSAKRNGSLHDVIKALDKEGIDYIIFDKVMTNPTIACAYEGAKFAKINHIDFIITIGGGSPMDAAKAMALLAKQDIKEGDLFNGQYTNEVLPIVAIPTTAGTGAEVTQYSILTNDKVENKTSIASELIFPKLAFIDEKYMMRLPVTTTINTAIDALSHAIEGMLSTRSSIISDTLAKECIRLFIKSAPILCQARMENKSNIINATTRYNLIQSAMLAGVVIAQTGTTAVHAMGYSLTYFKHIDHGRANGLLLSAYMNFVKKQDPQLIANILNTMGMTQLNDFQNLLNQLLGHRENITQEDIVKYSKKAVLTGNIQYNCKVKPSQQDVYDIFMKVFNVD